MQITTLQYHTFIDSNPSSYVDVFTAGYLVITPPLVLIGGLLAEGRTRDVCRFGQPRRADWPQKGTRNNGRERPKGGFPLTAETVIWQI